MATLLHSESRRLYSWWWDSHISPKNSKWLQENLTDMDAKVKAMIKLIEEDADSFARRAEMYYKKRPELMKLVEEFYRAYRALAERYNHATGELCQAHRTMAEAFPNQVPFVLTDDTPSSSEPHTPIMPLPIRSFFDVDDSSKDGSGLSSSNFRRIKRTGACAEESDSGAKRKGLKQLNEMFHAGDAVPQDAKSTEVKGEGKEYILAEDLAQLSDENQNLKARILSESERAGKAETELQILKEALAKVEAERDAVLFQHQQILEKLTNLEKELSLAQKDARDLDQQASKAETEVKVLKESLVKLEAERDANLLKYRESLDRVAVLETMITAAREDARGMSDQAAKAETESHNLKQELRRSEGEKEAGRLLYEQCLEKISVLENQVSLAEENAKILDKQSCRAQSEVKALKEQLLKLNEEKEDIGIQYNQCLEMISKLQNELREAQEDARWLNNEILLGSAKLKGTEEKCALLGKMNQSLQLEADDLAQQISTKDQELSEKQAELEKLQSSLQDERCRFVQVEATLHTLQNLHSQSQEEQRALASELRVGLQMLKDLKLSKQNLEAEIKQLMEENRSLNDLNLASSISEKNLQGQLSHLREIKEKLEGEVRRQAEQTDSLQQEVHLLKEEMEELYKRYQALMKQVEYVGLDPECLGSSVKSLQEENSRLKKSSCMDRAEKELLCKKLEHMDDLLKKSCVFESSLTDVSAELERSKEKARTLQDSCLVLNGEKSTLITEKAALLSQLQILAESMQKILEKNASLENSLSSANSELEGLRAKSKSLEEFCQLLNSERSNLLAEKSALMFRLENVEQKLEILETRFTKLEDNYACLEKENQSTLSQVEELRVSLGVEKQERACLVLTSEARVSSLEDRIYHLQEENKCRKNEFEEQLDKAANAQFEIFILKKFIEDMEEKNYSLLFECQKHVEAGKYSEKLIAELEGENMMQQVETEFLLDKISKLRMGIYQVLKALEINHVGEAESDLNVMPCILANIKDIRSSLSESKDENQQLVIGNSILTTVVKQLYLEVKELASRKEVLDQEFLILTRQHSMLENEKRELSQRNCCLDVKLSQREKAEEALKAEIEGLHEKLVGIEVLHAALQEENLKALKEKHFLQVELSDLLVAKCKLEQDNDTVFLEALAVSIQDVIFQSYGIEKALELDRLYKDLDCLRKAYSDLEEEAIELRTWLEMKDVENLNVRESIKILEEKQHELNGYHDQFKCEMLLRQELLDQKESELLEAEQELKATQDLNTGLRQTVELVEKECEDLKVARENLEDEILELSKYNRSQDEEIGRLQEANERLESQTGSLQEKIEEYKIREAILSSELHERSGEFELWEAEAASFYFDLQISGIREVLFENKVQELGGLCEDLEVVSSRRSVEIGMMKEKVSLLESEVEGLKNQLAAYVPVIASLKDDIESLEQDPFLQTKLHLANSTDKQVVTVESNISEPRDLNSLEPDGLSQLQKLQSKVKVIQKLLIEVRERVAMQERKKADIKLEATMKEIEELRSRINALRQKNIHEEEGRYGDPRRVNGILMESGPEASEARNRTRMKDIPLDQVSDSSSSGNSKRRNGHPDDEMLQLWETAERASSRDLVVSKTLEQALMPKEDEVLYHEFVIGEQNSLNPTIESQIEKELGVDKLELSKNCNNSNHEGNKLNILERLACDAQKLMDLQISVQELRMKMETNKRKRSTKDVEYDRLRDQLRDVENSVMQLVDMNTELMKTVEDRPSTSNAVSSMELDEGDHVLRKRVAEQVRRGSEKIARLQLELQKIQYMWQKMEDEKKRKGKGRFSRSHAGFVLRDFVYSHGRSRRQKKGRFCGCLRPTPEEN